MVDVRVNIANRLLFGFMKLICEFIAVDKIGAEMLIDINPLDLCSGNRSQFYLLKLCLMETTC